MADYGFGARSYQALPLCMKAKYSPEEWMWLPDSEKDRVMQSETEPDDDAADPLPGEFARPHG